MPYWFNWITNSKLAAAADYTLSGGRLLISDAKDVLAMLGQESVSLISKEIGPSNYGKFYPTDRHGGFWKLGNPVGVVDHYTAGINTRPVLLWFSSRPREGDIVSSSAHFVIGRDGIIYSVVPPDLIAWHATVANDTHIGIEHVNAGVLRRKTGTLRYQESIEYPKERTHSVQTINKEPWEPYTSNQLIANIVLKRWLIEAFPSIEQQNCVDHAKISPDRKRDCGPLWPLKDLNKLVFDFTNARKIEWHDKQAIAKKDLTSLALLL